MKIINDQKKVIGNKYNKIKINELKEYLYNIKIIAN